MELDLYLSSKDKRVKSKLEVSIIPKTKIVLHSANLENGGSQFNRALECRKESFVFGLTREVGKWPNCLYLTLNETERNRHLCTKTTV
jgi:hypothetical protein